MPVAHLYLNGHREVAACGKRAEPGVPVRRMNPTTDSACSTRMGIRLSQARPERQEALA